MTIGRGTATKRWLGGHSQGARHPDSRRRTPVHGPALHSAPTERLFIRTIRIRNGTMGAEGVLHDLGVIGITSSDAQGMGRAGETVRRTFQLAAKNKQDLLTEPTVHDNDRVRQYMAKLTINPAIAHGLSHEIGSLDIGKLADIVLWRPDHFGAKPQLVLKAGFPAYGMTGDPNATTDSCQPLVMGPQFGSYGSTAADLSVAFVSQAAIDAGDDHMTTRRRRVAVKGTRNIDPANMVLNNRLGTVDVDAKTGMVSLDGESVYSAPSETVSLSRLYFL
jgi:urease subunit alpha